MAVPAGIECDLVHAGTGEKLHTVTLPRVPRIGEELHLDLGGDRPGEDLYDVVVVQYHLRRRSGLRADDLFGVTLYIVPAA